jgi:hypothetical protein
MDFNIFVCNARYFAVNLVFFLSLNSDYYDLWDLSYKGDTEVCCLLRFDTVAPGGSVRTFRSILVPQSCSWPIWTAARRNIPEDETCVDDCLILWRTGSSPWTTVWETLALCKWVRQCWNMYCLLEVCSIEFRRAVCQYWILSHSVNLHDCTVNGAEVIVR